MKKTLILLVIIFSNYAFSQSGNWHLRADFIRDVGGKMEYKQEGNTKFTFYSDVDITERYSIIGKIHDYIKDNLRLIKESELQDSIDIIIVRNRDDMTSFVGGPISGIAYTATDEYIKQKTIICIGGKKNPLKHELMHIISTSFWGVPIGRGLSWLEEGLATFADPEAECDNYSFEEKYIYFIQNKKIIDADSLINNFDNLHKKISYNQSGYIVEFLINNYGIEKLKEIWVNGMNNFEKVYNSTFKEVLERIRIELTQKYAEPIELDWSEFEKTCY
ncbi:MAG: hypothetical protein LBR46_00550 [Prevotella sp.]|jgi:hypothetical protein|nr:hypothetical protein [Prevotella sp.]